MLDKYPLFYPPFYVGLCAVFFFEQKFKGILRMEIG